MIYRTHVFDTEVSPHLEKHVNDDITFICEGEFDKLGIQFLDTKNAINNIYTFEELFSGKIDNMKFDYIVGNPPYQQQVGPDKTQQIWSELVVKFYDLLKDGGEMSMIHPGGWRFTTDGSMKNLKKIKEIYSTNKITYAEFNDISVGYETFGVGTDFDIINLVKKSSNEKTYVKTKSGKHKINFNEFNIIPTDRIDLYKRLKAKAGEEKVEILTNMKYHTQLSHMSEDLNDEFKFPCIYTITENKGIKCHYSNSNKHGDFGIKKLILKRAATSNILDLEGQYGMTQFAFAIIDTSENLVRIQKALESKEAKLLKRYFFGAITPVNAYIDGLGNMLKAMKEFRKDFWKDFYTDEMEQELIAEGKLNPDGTLNV